MTRSCVIGWPISHSRSPMIHHYWLRQLGIDGSYERIPVEPERLQSFLHGLADNGFAGCNVTLPHKEHTYRLVTPVDESTERLGAVNTVFVRDGKLLGTNTDGEGFINSLQFSAPALAIKDCRALVLGAGGAAMAISNALLLHGASEVVISNRSIDKAMNLRARFGSRIRPVEWASRNDQLAGCSLLVNTTSLGMKGQNELEMDLAMLPHDAVVTDIVYVPLRTRLLVEAAARGNPVVEGLGMLLHQAVHGFELWFGVRPAVTKQLHDMIAHDIDPEFGT